MEFASPIDKLITDPPNTIAPTGGKGLVLDDKGLIPGGVLFVRPGIAPEARRIAYGQSTVTWPGGAVTSNVLTVTHGLDVTPIVVLATVAGNSGVTLGPTLAAQSYTSTTFTLTCWTVDAQQPLNTATTTVAWMVIG